MTVEKIDCGGVTVRYRFRPAKGGPAGSTTIIFLHNAGTDHTIWSPVADILAGGYSVAQLDWPGYGEVRSEPGGHGLGDYADILSAFIARQGLESVVLAGNCLGSGAALECCFRRKGSGIAAMILFNVLVPRTLGADGRFFLNWSASALGFLYKKLRENLVVPRAFAGFALKRQTKNIDLISVSAVEHLKTLHDNPANIRNLGSLVEALDDSRHLDSLEMPDYFPPTMIVWGDGNRVLPLSRGERFVRDFNPTEFVVENGGHLVMLEQPRICADNIRRFIESRVPVSK